MVLAEDFRRLLRHTGWAMAVCLAAVVCCYYWVDRPVAFYVHRHALDQIGLFRWLTYPPATVQAWSPLILTLLMVRRAWGPLRPCQQVLLVALLSLIVAHAFRTSLGGLCGRYWPETWFHVNPALAQRPGGPALVAGAYLNNPSLIGNGQYGFHPFPSGDNVGSFPSGHATRILGFATVWWLALPRSRAVLLLACPPMLFSLVAMNYHFVGDVVAGSVLGAIVGVYAVCLADLRTGGRIAPGVSGWQSPGRAAAGPGR